ncbi:MAG: acyl-CoA dehydrogenase [Phenylobacterium sp. RIFCSPHIGHO2_01_FULL_69_31]|uniref:acyl-CoA dehydrogenase family protein n=1 Tax=Phenylobacterium sp. RIFCSPHIGHO2_01_FULL_69_31 TaxID=1801944 RepID=UPI0008B56159|nr:acyl-CoA dehydrogenase family protein [Phenylobacterium sp. RIFCSPHIGHO2_01_FULL_69_31]OHB27403.1 MAG: acyl-CoA dehydrogenase [Phenylobacterium sp. RIFCSPHIGHO2_01_FULL_69_31]
MTIDVKAPPAAKAIDWVRRTHDLGPKIAARAAQADETDAFVAENLALLKAEGFHTAAVPAELGGGGASHAELAAMLRTLSTYCGSTALALAMHTHAVALPAWRWRRTPEAVEGLLKRVVAEGLTLVSSGGSDWLDGSCRATPVEGGFRVSGRKVFASGCQSGDLLVTMAVLDAPEGPTVLHLAIPMRAEGVKVLDTWRTLGMRGTGSHDLELTEVFVPDAAVTVRRPQGKWHPLMHMVSLIAFPLIMSVYMGLAEAAAEKAVDLATARKPSPDTELLIGEMETHLTAARLALGDMLACAAGDEPGPAATSRIMTGRTLVARAAIATVEKAMEAAGGAGFYRKTGLERIWRDVQAARYHPLQEKPQARLAGRLALGLPIDG